MPPLPAFSQGPRPNVRLERLIEISRSLSQPYELEPLLQKFVDAACELTLSESGSISVFEAETGLLKFVAMPQHQRKTLKRLRVPLEGSLAGQCFTQSRPIVIANARQDTRIFRAIDQELELETHSIVAVPIIYQNETIGVLEAINKKRNAHYTEEDVTILETLASYAAIAIQTTRVREKLERTSRDIEALDRMKSDFIAIASHELRTPLGLILGHATFMREQTQDAQQRQELRIIVENALRLKQIIENLESVEKGQGQTPTLLRKAFALEMLIQEVVQSFEVAAQKKRVALINDLPEKSLIIEGDAEKTAIALSNILKNALTFTNEGGHVLVSAEKLAGYVKVSVVDDGIGIPATDLHRVFERFFQVESHMTRKHGGMGLGLSVAKVMIEMQGGQIWVESIEGQGSNFSFLLPVGGQAPTKKQAAFVET